MAILDVEDEIWKTHHSGTNSISGEFSDEYGNGTSTGLLSSLQQIDNSLKIYFDKMNKYDEISPVTYEKHSDEIQTLITRTGDFNSYASSIYASVDSQLETFAKEQFQRALELLSNVSNLNRYETDNDLGIRELQSYTEYDTGEEFKFSGNKRKLKFSDFLPPIDNSDIALSCGTLDRKDTYVNAFAELYKKEYDDIQLILQDQGTEFTLEEYNDMVLYGSSFNYQADYNWKTFVTDVLNASIIYPIITGAVGYDPILGYDLTDDERTSRVTTGVISGVLTIATLGLAPAGLTAGQLALYTLSNIGIGMAGTGAGSLSEQAFLAVGVSPEVASLLAAGVSFAVSYKLGKYNYGKWAEVGQANLKSAKIAKKLLDPNISSEVEIDADSVTGYRIKEDAPRLKDFSDIDFSDPKAVSNAQSIRKPYLDAEIANQNTCKSMLENGASTEEVGRYAVELRNQTRINANINNPEVLESMYDSNLRNFGNKFGMTPEQAFEKYGSWEKVINASTRTNPAMDIALGLYEPAIASGHDYSGLYSGLEGANSVYNTYEDEHYE